MSWQSRRPRPTRPRRESGCGRSCGKGPHRDGGLTARHNVHLNFLLSTFYSLARRRRARFAELFTRRAVLVPAQRADQTNECAAPNARVALRRALFLAAPAAQHRVMLMKGRLASGHVAIRLGFLLAIRRSLARFAAAIYSPSAPAVLSFRLSTFCFRLFSTLCRLAVGSASAFSQRLNTLIFFISVAREMPSSRAVCVRLPP